MLPEELIIKILVRLPVVSIVRCMCVCKQWLSLIKSPYFISAHLSSSSSSSSSRKKNICNFLGFLDGQIEGAGVVTLHINPESLLRDYKILSCRVDHFVEIVGSVDGVICLHSDVYDVAYLWNPAISRLLQFPPPLSEHPLERWVTLGFFFRRSDYKVVRVAYGDISSPSVGIYSLKDRSWSFLLTGVTVGVNRVRRMWYPQHFINGRLHWLAMESISPLDMLIQHTNLIVVFDVVEEKLTKMEFPQQLIEESQVVISEIKGLLAIINDHAPTNDFHTYFYGVWVMKEYGVAASWTLIYRIRYQDPGLVSIFGFYGDGNEVLVRKRARVHSIQDYSTIWVLYNPENNDFKDFVIDDNLHNLAVDYDEIVRSIYIGTYVESLVLLDMESVHI